jgi:hypothetical protein
MGWVRPTGYEDPNNFWANEPNAYDGDTATYSQSNTLGTVTWSYFLILTRATITCDSVRFYCAVPNEPGASIDIDIRRDGVWEDLYQGTFTAYEWVEKSFAMGNIDAMRIRLYNPSTIYARVGRIFEAEFYEVEPAVPTVVTNDAGEITPTGAKLNGDITALYPTPCDERGFEWGTTPGVYPYSWTETGSFGVGVFNHVLTGLEEGTTYYFRAKAHNSEGWGYGAEKSFTPSESEVELRLSNVDPPTPEPKRTIYRDIVNLPSTVKLGLTIRYFNYDDVGLYFQITGSGTGYTFGTVNLGLLASGANAYQNLDEFASRAKPSASDLPNGEKEENITLTLKAYTDSGYSNLKWTFERVVTVHWINSADAAWTVDPQYPAGNSTNFDNGTVQGWAAANELNNDSGYPTLEVATDYVLSTPYSVKMTGRDNAATSVTGQRECRSRLYKSFTTPNKDTVYAIADIRYAAYASGNMMGKNLQIARDTTLLIFIGRPYDTVGTVYIPANKWVRLVVPLPKNTTLEIRLIMSVLKYYSGGVEPYQDHYLWLDDFKIISK